MLYKFKSRVTGDVIMLEPNGRRLLEIIGKDPGAPGIIEAADAPAAIHALEAAIVREEAEQKAAVDEAAAQGEPAPHFEGISLRQRAVPLIDMLRRSEKAGQEVVWGVYTQEHPAKCSRANEPGAAKFSPPSPRRP